MGHWADHFAGSACVDDDTAEPRRIRNKSSLSSAERREEPHLRWATNDLYNRHMRHGCIMLDYACRALKTLLSAPTPCCAVKVPLVALCIARGRNRSFQVEISARTLGREIQKLRRGGGRPALWTIDAVVELVYVLLIHTLPNLFLPTNATNPC